MYLYILIAFSFWAATIFLDTVFRSCMLPPYVKLLQDGKLKIKPGYIQYFTTSWNRKLAKWGCYRPNVQRNWFSIGTVLTCLLMPFSVITLLFMIKNAILRKEIGDQIIQPVMPGVNLPLSDLGFYLVSILFCSIIHELGHALAASREDVKIEGIGIFFLGIFPGAYVSLPTDQIMQVLTWQKLQIFCAGIWHNIALGGISYFLLAINPYILIPLYQNGNGVTCSSVIQGSGISGPTGLKYNDHIISINNCVIKTKDDWFKCINKTTQESQHGFCISSEFLSQQDASLQFPSEKNCCTTLMSSNLCFEINQKFLCLPVRKMLQTSPTPCSLSEDCKFCAKPILENHHHRLLKIGRRNQDNVLFIGSPLELTTSVEISSYVPRFGFISLALIMLWEKLLNYILAFSGALAILNIMPCWGLDGQWITEALVDITLKHYMPKSVKRKITYLLTTGGTVVLVTAVLFGVYSLFR